MKKILIIEDEIAYIKLLHDQLSKMGYVIFTANEGKKGLDLAKQEQPELILLDVRMPGMNGIDMLDALRKDQYGRSAKVILLTNLEPDDAMVRKVIEDQPSFYLVKSDIQLTDLIEKIKELLS